MKSTRFSGKISSDPTKKSGRKTPLPYKAKTGIFSPAAPKNRRRAKKTGAAPHAPGGFAPCARPAAPRRRPADLAPCAPPRRAARPAAGQPPARRARARRGPPVPAQAPPFFSPRRCPAPPAFARQEVAAAPRARRARRRPAAAPPARKKKRAARAAARPSPRPSPCPKGESNPRARFGGDRGPLSREFPRNSGPGGYAPKIKKRQKKSGEKKKSSCPCGQMPQMAR